MQKVRNFLKKIFIFSGLIFAVLAVVLIGFILVFTYSKNASNTNKVILLKNTFLAQSNNINTFAFHNDLTGTTWLYHVPVESAQTEELTGQKASQLFGLLISKTISLPSPKQVSESKDFSKTQVQETLRNAVFNTQPFDKDFWEYWWWWWHIRSRSSTQLKSRSFDSLESWKQYATERDFQVSTQPCSIAVVNTTGVNGLATEVGDILERSGLFVARLTNNQSNTSNSLILTKNPEECKEVIEAVGILTPNSAEVAIDEAAATRYRARVVILVGKDLIIED